MVSSSSQAVGSLPNSSRREFRSPRLVGVFPGTRGLQQHFVSQGSPLNWPDSETPTSYNPLEQRASVRPAPSARPGGAQRDHRRAGPLGVRHVDMLASP